MGHSPGIIQRAFELAPECESVTKVRGKLKAEGYSQIEAHLSGRMIKGQLVERLLPNNKKRRV